MKHLPTALLRLVLFVALAVPGHLLIFGDVNLKLIIGIGCITVALMGFRDEWRSAKVRQ